MDKIAKEMQELFLGASYVHGVYDMTNPVKIDNKVKGKPKTVAHGPAIDHWIRHLTTPVGLGVAPIECRGRIKNKVLWGVIDIDNYEADYKGLIESTSEHPLVPVRTKSGGLNIFVFFKAWTNAGTVKKCLKALAVKLGYGGSEVFPKQSKVLVEQGDSANWVNMPYLNGEDRPGVNAAGEPLSITEFITLAKSKKTTVKEIDELPLRLVPATDHPHIPDGPPCLQKLTNTSFPKGSRNRALMNLGIYYKKAFPDDWKEKVEAANKQWMSGTHDEVQNIIRSLEKKDYHYTCQDEPLCAHCDAATCSQRKFGVTSTLQLPHISELTKVRTAPPVYFFTIDEERVGPLSSGDMMDQNAVARVIFEVTNKPMMIKKADWYNYLSDAMQSANEVDSPEARGEYGRFLEQLGEYLISGHVTDERSEVAVGRVLKEDNKRYFKIDSLMNYLEQHGFKYTRNELVAILKEEKLKPTRIKIKNRHHRVWVAHNVEVDEPVDKKERKSVF